MIGTYVIITFFYVINHQDCIEILFSSEEDGEGGRRGGGGRGRGKGGLKKIFKACKDQVPELEDLDCPDRQRPKVFPESACADLSQGDEFPDKRDIPKPCEDASEVTNIFNENKESDYILEISFVGR